MFRNSRYAYGERLRFMYRCEWAPHQRELVLTQQDEIWDPLSPLHPPRGAHECTQFSCLRFQISLGGKIHMHALHISLCGDNI
jgi:hypothetical protein